MMKITILLLLILSSCAFSDTKENDEINREIKSNIEIIENFYNQDEFDSKVKITEKAFVKAIRSNEKITGIKSHAEINWFIGYLRPDLLESDIESWRTWLEKR